jgi:oligopeptidase B
MKLDTQAQAPVVPKKPHTTEDGRQDPYFWLREKENPEVRKAVEAENAYFEAVTKPVTALREKLFEEMKARLEPTETAVPQRLGEWWYGWRTPEGKQYPIWFRQKGDLKAPEEVMLDLNALAQGHEYMSLGSWEPSHDQAWLAYSLDVDGSEHHKLRFKNFATGQVSPEEISDTSPGVAWATDNKHVFYTKLDKNDRPYQVWRHALGRSAQEDVLVYEEKDPRFFIGVDLSKDGKWLFIGAEAKTTSEVRYLDASKPLGAWKIVEPRRHGIEYSVESWEDEFVILTNDHEKNFRLVTAPTSAPRAENWTELFRGSPELYLRGVEIFKNHWALLEARQGLPTIRVYEPRTQREHLIEFGEPTYNTNFGWNFDHDSKLLRFHFSSPRTPAQVYDYDLETREKTLKKSTFVGGGFDPSNYRTERILVKSHDGTEVPVSLLYRKDVNPRAGAPVYLYGYGSYGASMYAGFGSVRLSLVDRGFVFALAHIRGGGELGRGWYEDGKFLNKKNTFLDFIAAAEGLIQLGIARRGEILIHGASAGGMLVGACMNMRPELFKVVLGEVPFVDVMNTMLDETLPLTPTEFDEWGNPKDKAYYDYMLSYSPYDNIEKKAYPQVLLTAGWNDPRVTYWEPAKMAARLRETRSDRGLTVLYTNLGAGHGGASGRYDSLKEDALMFAFVLGAFGIGP